MKSGYFDSFGCKALDIPLDFLHRHCNSLFILVFKKLAQSFFQSNLLVFEYFKSVWREFVCGFFFSTTTTCSIYVAISKYRMIFWVLLGYFVMVSDSMFAVKHILRHVITLIYYIGTTQNWPKAEVYAVHLSPAKTFQ